METSVGIEASFEANNYNVEVRNEDLLIKNLKQNSEMKHSE